MPEVKSETILIFKRFFLFRFLARIWWFIDLLGVLFAPVFLFVILAVVHLVIYRIYYLSFSSFCLCFVHP